MPLVEALKAKGIDARRATSEELSGPVDKALAARFPGATGLITDPDPMEYVLDREAIARQGLKVEDVEGTIREALLRPASSTPSTPSPSLWARDRPTTPTSTCTSGPSSLPAAAT